MSELNIIEAPHASPTECVRCKSPKGPFLDTGVEVLGYGRIYFCIGTDEQPGCLPQAARLLGYADPAARLALEEKLRVASIERDEAVQKLRPLESAAAAFAEYSAHEAARQEQLNEPPKPKAKAKK